jgi:hypothetical protein
MAPGRTPSFNLILVCASLAVAATLLTFQLLVPPIVGLADNGDFARVTEPVGLASISPLPEDRFFGWVQPEFALVKPVGIRSWYKSSETLLAGAAVLAVRIGRRDARVFDVRFLAGLHILLLLTAMGILIASCRGLAPATQGIVAFLLVFFFTDVGWAAAFNSLYCQTASLLFLMLTVAVAAAGLRRGGFTPGLALAYFLCAALFVCSKPQESLLGPLLAVFGVRMVTVPIRGLRRLAWGLAAALCLLSIYYYTRTPASIRGVAAYNVLFTEILPHSPDPAGDLADLGLDPSWIRYSGTNAFDPHGFYEDRVLRSRLLPHIGQGALLRLYLRHPKRIGELLVRAGKSSFELRPSDLGNFARSAGWPPGRQTSAFSAWSRLRSRLNGLTALAILLVGNAAAVAATYRRATRTGRLFREGLLLLVLMAAVEFGVCSYADALWELSRHLYAFHAMCDLILIADAGWACEALARRFSRPAIRA